jgi:hypothetical protein
MKLAEHVALLKKRITGAYDKHLARLGLGASRVLELEKLPEALHDKRRKLDQLIENHSAEMGGYAAARERALEELTFTLFNRLAALKVMEAHRLFPEVVTQRTEHGGRSFGHKAWLEQNPALRSEELEGLREYLAQEFDRLGEEIPLYHRDHPYALLPYVLDLQDIIHAFNAVAADPQVGADIWQSDDILGWLYESYNNDKKQAHKDSKAKTEYDKVSLQSQVYTPRWVVQFLVDNSLGKLYLEMYPDSAIKNRYAIANAPAQRCREPKPLTEIRLIDPACGSGNFELYAFDLYYDLYLDQIEHYGARYRREDIPRLIIEHNLHGIDLDDRAVQLAQLGLYIKARRKNHQAGPLKFQIVSSAFFLPGYAAVRHIFESPEHPLSDDQRSLVQEIWADLQQAFRFGSLVRVGEKVNVRLETLIARFRRPQMDIFAEKDIVDFEIFRENFFRALEKAVALFAQDAGETFLSAKTRDAITYLRLLTTSYDVAVANPPFTDSSDFGVELKTFIDGNYKNPHKFNSNLYAVFIKRCYELINQNGKLALIHPLTFMYIKSFEDVRKFIIDKLHINIFADYGPDATNLFDGSFASAPAFYCLEKKSIKPKARSLFISLDQYTRTRNEKFKKDFCLQALNDYIHQRENKHNYLIDQSKLKIIPSWPFIYWISDGFREKFGGSDIQEILSPAQGAATTNNNRFLRFWWEVSLDKISKKHNEDKLKWVVYSKGGPYKKWHGNLWLVINYEKNGKELNESKAVMRNAQYYFQEGVTYSASGSKNTSFRYLPPNCIFDTGGSCIFPNKDFQNTHYLLGFLNSKLTAYIITCLNPTVNSQVGDMQRVPFIIPDLASEKRVASLSQKNIKLKQQSARASIIERDYFCTPLSVPKNTEYTQVLLKFLASENHVETHILINEAIINEAIFNVYSLTPADRIMVLSKQGQSIGSLPVLPAAREAYLEAEDAEFPLDDIRGYIQSLPVRSFSAEEEQTIVEGFPTLYQSNNDLEAFCTRHQVNPINVWYWFRESGVLPAQRAHDIAMEFLADLIREILREDDDGIIPLVPNAGEKVLLERIEERFYAKGFSPAQYASFDQLLGRPLPEYLEGHFFRELSDHLNLFMYLPKTPFIWHLSSGPAQGFACYVLIYKWDRDKLYRLRSIYLEQRERALANRLADLQHNDTAAAQNEKERIGQQLRELETFKQKIDALLAEGYAPVLDDGVGKNIAPLQEKGMLASEVLNAGQLKKYLNADW